MSRKRKRGDAATITAIAVTEKNLEVREIAAAGMAVRDAAETE